MGKRKNSRGMKNFRFIDSMNSLVGSWFFLIIHVLWFFIWLAYDLDINMLTMIVSLEAIILMILLLMSQNKQALRDDIRDEMDLRADLRSAKLTEEILVHIEAVRRDIRNLKKK